ncbi:hypothetical protein ACWET9_30420 [Streptomyces sp. NPDC004059]|jgi:hypothetical protein|uniref:hypothetical protein n=1 Tax=unclassified Streptomyces TaxID=2593676 RepID=UPI00341D3E81
MRGSVMGTAVTLAAGALLTAAMTTASASPPTAAARAAAPRPVLVDCTWHQDVRPADFILACGDGNSRLLGLHWSQWSQDGATAKGTNFVNDCKPYCAAGRFHGYPVTVRLDEPKAWKKHPGVQHYTRMTLTYVDDRPEGFKQVMTYPLWD